MTDSTTTEIADTSPHSPVPPGTVRLISYARIGMKTTQKDGWGYESTVAVTAEYDSDDSDRAIGIMQEEIATLQDLTKKSGDLEVRIRTYGAEIAKDTPRAQIELQNSVREVPL